VSRLTILFVCTGNLCRSPSAAASLQRILDEDGTRDVAVHSAGTMQAAGGPPEPLLKEAEHFGLDLHGHVPRRMEPNDVTGADLVLAMTRQHLREAVLLDKAAFPRIFTLREFVRRAEATGPRPADVALEEWISVVNGGRRHLHLVGESPEDDVLDPMGGPPEGYRSMLEEVTSLTDALYESIWGASVSR
jgi:protein-tyrosine phosphatase